MVDDIGVPTADSDAPALPPAEQPALAADARHEQPSRKQALELQVRRAKVDKLRLEPLNAFPRGFADRTEIRTIREAHDPAAIGAGRHPEHRYRIAGRVTAQRAHGGAAFMDIRDRSGTLQVYAKADDLEPEAYRRVLELDVGDIVGAGGVLYVTRRGELSIAGEEVVLLGKALRPPPHRHQALTDPETRFRHRHLDLIANADARSLIELRAAVLSALRAWMDGHGFFEIDAPVLVPRSGGATARPFVTHHKALNRDLLLRVSSELYLKRFLIGGMERVYELGRFFRNEGISPNHSPEFTMLEWMHSYTTCDELATFVEHMIAEVTRRVTGSTVVERDGRTVDLTPPWRRVTVRDAIREQAGVDVGTSSAEELATLVGDDPAAAPDWAELVNRLYADRVEPTIFEPTIVFGFPSASNPLSRRTPGDARFAEHFDALVCGVELVTGAGELNDADEQRERIAAQRDAEIEGLEETDEEFLDAVDYGQTPLSGAGLGVDRLVMLLGQRRTLREVISFPALRERS